YRPRPRRAVAFTRGFELGAFLQQTDFNSDAEIKDDVGYGFRFGYLYTPRQEIEFLYNAVNTQDEFDSRIGVDVSHLQAAYVFNFTDKAVVPYLTAGFGFVFTSDDSLGDESDPLLGVGGGVRFFMGPTTYFRIEARHNRFRGDGTVFASDTTFTFNEVGFGLGWRFPTY
ncbi:MAG TPA: outer membrane beta-barrel protein, partial [Candidatus Polarisedimenticolia bacterium]|nr:outer membrane beta-barrel protein [Candidatus Polarisedimenticolia bacterium]